MGEDSNFYSTDSESEVFNQLYYPSILWNLRIRTACYRVFLVISPREHLHPTGFKSHIFCRSDGIPTRTMFKVLHQTRFLTFYFNFSSSANLQSHISDHWINTMTFVWVTLFASLSYGPMFVAVVRLELTSYGFKDRDNLTFILYRYVVLSEGLKPSTFSLGRNCSFNWAMRAYR